MPAGSENTTQQLELLYNAKMTSEPTVVVKVGRDGLRAENAHDVCRRCVFNVGRKAEEGQGQAWPTPNERRQT